MASLKFWIEAECVSVADLQERLGQCVRVTDIKKLISALSDVSFPLQTALT